MSRITVTPDKRPRHYAREILELPEAERKAALAQVPAEFQSIVRDHIHTWQQVNNHKRGTR